MGRVQVVMIRPDYSDSYKRFFFNKRFIQKIYHSNNISDISRDANLTAHNLASRDFTWHTRIIKGDDFD